MRTYLVLFLSIIIFICACTKSGTPPTPPILEDATVTVSAPADSSHFPKSAVVSITADVTGPADDYSFLRAYVIDGTNGLRDTVVRTSVSSTGNILATLPNTLQPGLHRFFIVVINPAQTDQAAVSDEFRIFIGVPSSVEITSLEKDDVSNTVHWTRSDASNFKAYEVYSLRTDHGPDRGEIPDGALRAIITNQDSLSFRDDSIYFHYRYSYMVKVITEEDYASKSERKEISSGTFLQFSENTVYSVTSILDKQRQKIYLPSGKLMIIDPQLMQVEDSIALPYPVYWINMNSSGNSLDVIFNTDFRQYRAASIDLDTRQVTLLQEFTLPTAVIMGVMDGTVIYRGSIQTVQPFITVTIAYDIVNNRSDTIRYHTSMNDFVLLSDNRILFRSIIDSFFVYKNTGGVFSLLKEEKLPGIGFSGPNTVNESSQYITVGHVLFDQSFNKVFEIDPGGGDDSNYFNGISNDGTYVVTRRNEIINTSSRQIERKYGDGFGFVAYFSNDNDVLYQYTSATWSVRWVPPLRLFRFPWR